MSRAKSFFFSLLPTSTCTYLLALAERLASCCSFASRALQAAGCELNSACSCVIPKLLQSVFGAGGRSGGLP